MSANAVDSSRLRVAVARLSLVEEGEDVTVGNPTTGTFVAVPAIGGVVLRALAGGASVPEAASAAREHAGVDVDVDDFLSVLEGAGVLICALVLAAVINLVMQCAVFLRSDLYAVLACALRCENLYRVSWLTLKRRLLRLRPDEERELGAASARDRSVAGWFSLLYLVGMLAVFWFLLNYVLPSAGGYLYWMVRNIASLSIGQGQFWESVVLAAIVVVSNLAPIPLAIRERRLRRKGELS